MNCPICGTRKRFADAVGTMYDCGTWIEANGYKSQGDACVMIHYPKLKERAKRLEEAGDALDMRIGCGCGFDSCRTCMHASETWEQAKASK